MQTQKIGGNSYSFFNIYYKNKLLLNGGRMEISIKYLHDIKYKESAKLLLKDFGEKAPAVKIRKLMILKAFGKISLQKK